MSEPREDLTALERSLSGLAPRGGLDRDRLMYEAGRRAGGRRDRRWPLVAAALALTTIGQAVALSRRPAERVVERVVTVPAPTPKPEPVVILTRREPAPPERPMNIPRIRSRSLTARSDLASILEPEPPLLSAVRLGPLDVVSPEPLTPRSILGGPL